MPYVLDEPRSSAPAKLAHVVFKTPRLDEMVTWYSLVLDAVVVFRNRRLAFLTYDQEHHRVALIRLPRLFKIPGLVWSLHRKFWGFDHVAFTYRDLPDLMATYQRLARAGVRPIWCINHGPTTSLYYEDPDGNRLELQVDNFATHRELLEWMHRGEFDRNPIGTEFDPGVLAHKLEQGVARELLVKRGSAPPPGAVPRSGLRAVRWKTL